MEALTDVHLGPTFSVLIFDTTPALRGTITGFTTKIIEITAKIIEISAEITEITAEIFETTAGIIEISAEMTGITAAITGLITGIFTDPETAATVGARRAITKEATSLQEIMLSLVVITDTK